MLLSAAVRRSFDSLAVPNYRRYFVGQLVSLSGIWAQMVAAVWLILSLTHSGFAVGLTTALQFLPMLLFGAWGGLLADRFPKRDLLIVTQLLMALPAVGLLAVSAAGVVAPWMVYLAALSRGAVNGGAGAYAALVSAMGVGSVAGALIVGSRGRTGPRLIAAAALAFGGVALLAAAMPSIALEIPMLALLGAAAVTFAASVNSTLQLAVEPAMRGRVMSLYSVVFLGSTPIGGPLSGWLSEAYDPRVALLLAAVAGLAAAWAARATLGRMAGPAEATAVEVSHAMRA